MTKRAPNVQYLSIDQLVPAEDNFRGPVGDVSELAESIRAVGISSTWSSPPRPTAASGWSSAIAGWRRPGRPG
jgi:hypothetical protein